jgi:hypothetical protein
MKKIRYWLLFCPLHFMIWELQPAVSEEERKEFYEKFHQNNLND